MDALGEHLHFGHRHVAEDRVDHLAVRRARPCTPGTSASANTREEGVRPSSARGRTAQVDIGEGLPHCSTCGGSCQGPVGARGEAGTRLGVVQTQELVQPAEEL